MKTIPLARNGIISPIIKFLDNIDTPLESYFNQANIPPLALEDPENCLPLPMLMKFVAKVARAEGIDNLGITVAKTSSIVNTGIFGYLISQSFNTYDLAKRLCHFTPYAISIKGEKFWLIESEENIWLCQQFVKPLNFYYGFHHVEYYTLIMMLDCLRLALSDLSGIPDIYLKTSPEKAQGLEEQINLSNTRLHFNKPFLSICIPKKILNITVKNSLKTNIVNQKLNVQEWKSKAPVFDFVSSLEQTVKALLLEKYPTIDIMAEATGLSVRSLQRYLSQHNLTYSRLIDKVRYELSLSLLNNPDISLIEISYRLGFKYPANFSHSFRRWAGISPSQFRQYSLLN